MNQEKFQTGAIVFLVFAVNVLMFMIWQQNVAIANLTRAVNSLSVSSPRSMPLEAMPAPQMPPAAMPAPAPVQ